jgi:hypothetical protein
MTATQRHDAQVALNRPAMTLQDAGRRAERINSAMADLYEVALVEGRAGRVSPEVWKAVGAVTEARRG